MNDPTSIREALVVEAIGDAANLVDSIAALTPTLNRATKEIAQVHAELRATLDSFEARMTKITETAKTRALEHVAVRTDAAARQVIELQTRAMTEASRATFGSELGAALRRLGDQWERQCDQLERRWQWTALAASIAGMVIGVFSAWLGLHWSV